jgi:hypothetical protein
MHVDAFAFKKGQYGSPTAFIRRAKISMLLLLLLQL